jgi:hypothetical protein
VDGTGFELRTLLEPLLWSILLVILEIGSHELFVYAGLKPLSFILQPLE